MAQTTTTQTATVLAVCVVGTLGIALVLLFFITVPDKNAQLLAAVIGYLAAMAQVAVSYYFGSTKNSTTKDETMAAMAAAVTGTGDGRRTTEDKTDA